MSKRKILIATTALIVMYQNCSPKSQTAQQPVVQPSGLVVVEPETPVKKLPVASRDAVGWDSLSEELEGYAHETTGGLDGVVYTVTNFTDYNSSEKPLPGTLRYGIEKYERSAKLWIRFEVGDGQPKVIQLTRKLSLNRSHLTIDGRGAQITLETPIDWSKYELVAGGAYRDGCAPKAGNSSLGMMTILGQQNIILTHLNFTRSNYKSSFSNDDTIDKECLGDMVGIANHPKYPTPVHRIWLNRLSFEKCGDECIGITRPKSAASYHGVSISNSHFKDTSPFEKGLLIYGGVDEADAAVPGGVYPYRVSLYRNTFESIYQRNPSVGGSSLVHVYNNKFVDWGSVVLLSRTNSRCFFEGNILIGSEDSDPEPLQTDDTGRIFSNDNLSRGASVQLPITADYVAYRERWVKVPTRVIPAQDLD